jgi:hypothetical protein
MFPRLVRHTRVVVAILCAALGCDPRHGTVAPASQQSDETLERRRQVATASSVLCSPGDDACLQRASQERIAAEQRQEMRHQDAQTRQLMEGQHNERMQLEREKELDGDWYCFEGEAGGRSAGACRKNREECIDAALRAVDAGLGGNVGCQRQAAVTCYGAVRSLDEERVVRCFPSVDSCGRHHARLEGDAGWSELTECLPL